MSKRAQNKAGKGGHAAALVAGVAAAALLVYLLSVFAPTVRAMGVSYSAAGGYGMMGGMMSSGTLSQSEISACNQMMQSFGLNQSVIGAMDRMMSSGMMGGMRNMHLLP